jgi:hypothetical protein
MSGAKARARRLIRAIEDHLANKPIAFDFKIIDKMLIKAPLHFQGAEDKADSSQDEEDERETDGALPIGKPGKG